MKELKGLIVTQSKYAAYGLTKEMYAALLKGNTVGSSKFYDVASSIDNTISFVSELAGYPIKYTYYIKSIKAAYLDGMDFSSFIITSGALMKASEDDLHECITRMKDTIIPSGYDPFGPLTNLLPGFPR
ncbi:hypothetical protein M3M39_04975 [Fructilactobacillus hinvesii]|uniref:Uncharacterized protein n=1 Tax=Fructilactobacillus hinvesii TaxID=2940300 RepID=A0ABY5BQZ7_9LACO|nr:hypothetical protein [Fructilactobacillus hinvesii]USS87477.1 hypothetical protein M3M39_04975 [Fructilactobacillus hinvesii]